MAVKDVVQAFQVKALFYVLACDSPDVSENAHYCAQLMGIVHPKHSVEARRSVSHLLTVPCCASDHARAESKEASTPSVNSSFNTYHCLHHALIS